LGLAFHNPVLHFTEVLIGAFSSMMQTVVTMPADNGHVDFDSDLQDFPAPVVLLGVLALRTFAALFASSPLAMLMPVALPINVTPTKRRIRREDAS
jgi:hypothetical protein